MGVVENARVNRTRCDRGSFGSAGATGVVSSRAAGVRGRRCCRGCGYALEVTFARESGRRKTACFCHGCNHRLRAAFAMLAESTRHSDPWAEAPTAPPAPARVTTTPQTVAANRIRACGAVVVDDRPITCARQVAAPADAWEDRQVMLGTARDQAAPLLGRAEEQSLLTSLLDEVDDRGQALCFAVSRASASLGCCLSPRARARARDDGAQYHGRAVRSPSAVCRVASAASPGARACSRAAACPTRRAQRGVRPDRRRGA